MTKRRTRIVVETQEVIVLRGRGLAGRNWCPVCARRVTMITPEQAANILGSTTPIIYSWVEAEIIHSSEEPAGSVLICLNSLPPV